jgi:GH35 family endo-1,4-beta-xylanase
MKKITGALFITLLGVFYAGAQPNRKSLDSIRRLSELDHKKMMDLLHIDSLRPGVNGSNPNAPNAANYDESKANPYPNLPDPLVLKNSGKVTNVNDWWQKRRPEIVEDFDREIYGRIPANTPAVKWEITATAHEMNGDIPVITKKLVGHVDNSSFPVVSVDIQLTVTTPANASGPVPMVMELAFVFPPGSGPPAPLQGAPDPGTTWQQQLLAKGWGYAVLIPVSIQADNGAGLTQGIIGLMNKGRRRKPDDWGTLRAWAWGASRAMDYFETDKAVDAKRVGIEGHSRYGKAAAVTMAYDSRFAIAYISSSGEGGIKLHRRNAGEIVENVASSGEYHWMAGNFLKYAGPLGWNDLPVDAHELVALCAPRPVFIGCGDKGDGWVDARGMFMAAAAAGPVYRLLGKKDLGRNSFPPVETALINGDIGFRQHGGGHTPAPNWPTFIGFASRYFTDRNELPVGPLQSGLNGKNASPGLKDYYKDYFPIGVAVSPQSLKRADESALILQQFNSITPENAMKMGPIHPKENEYYWKDADSIVAFAQLNGLKVRGHNLCWHQQTPGWMFKDAEGNTVTKTVLLKRLKDHITTVVGRYKGKIYAWDVVNEAVDDKPGNLLRNSPWYQICGPDFIAKAFEYAHAADPDAILFYNDYNTDRPEKMERVYQLLKQLKAAGVPVNGVGLQAHWSVYDPSREALENTIKKFASLSLQVQITELDISLYPWEKNTRQKLTSDDDTFTPQREQQQIEKYKMIFDVFRKYHQYITGVTFWNISDRHSWLDNYPVPGRKNYPLLFDQHLQPKKAYRSVVDALK